MLQLINNILPKNWAYYLIGFILINWFCTLVFNSLALIVDYTNKHKKFFWIELIVKSFTYIFYFCLNLSITIFISWLFLNVLTLCFKISHDNIIKFSVVLSVLLNLTSLIIAYSSLGEYWIRIFNTRRLTKDEDLRILPLLKEVLINATSKCSIDIGSLKLRMIPDNSINAYACGRKTILLTTGITEKLSDRELKGILAHEIAHIVNKDSLNNCLFSGLIFFINLYYSMIITLNIVLDFLVDKISILIFIFWPLILYTKFSKYIIERVFELTNVLFNSFSKKQEHLADQFAVKIGYQNELLEAITKIDSSEFKDLTSNLQNSHPTFEFRAEALKYGYYNS